MKYLTVDSTNEEKLQALKEYCKWFLEECKPHPNWWRSLYGKLSVGFCDAVHYYFVAEPQDNPDGLDSPARLLLKVFESYARYYDRINNLEIKFFECCYWFTHYQRIEFCEWVINLDNPVNL